jgi:predicted DNA-binding ribbon-helix-helix protein
MNKQPRNKGKFGVKGTEPLGRRISVRLHQSVEDKLSVIAAKKNVSSSELIRWIVSDAVLGEGKYLELIGKEDENE